MKLRSSRLVAAIAVAGALSFALPVYAQSSSAGSDSNTATMEGGAKEMYHGAKNGVSDTWITSKVKEELMTDKTTKNYTIHVDTHDNGIVNLSGDVPAPVASRAQEIAQNVSGVRKVNNDMQVSGSATSSR